MSGNVTVLDSSNHSAWESAYLQLPDSIRDINFSFSYHRLFEKNGDGEMRLFIYSMGESVFFYPFLIRPVLNACIDKGFRDIETVYGYTGPVSTDMNPDFLVPAMIAFKQWCLEQKVVCEFIRFHPVLENHSVAIADPELRVQAIRDYVLVDLAKNAAVIWNDYSAPNRNKIRKAEKSGLIVEQHFSESNFHDFVSIYLDNMKSLRASRMYFFSDKFFDGLGELIRDKGSLLVARNGNKSVGAAAFLHDGKVSHYFLAAASPEGKKLAAGNILLHKGILLCREKDADYLHLGGGMSQDVNDPLLIFKKNFSKLTRKFYIGKRIHNKPVYGKLIDDWDLRFPEAAPKYSPILQRYRYSREDLT